MLRSPKFIAPILLGLAGVMMAFGMRAPAAKAETPTPPELILDRCRAEESFCRKLSDEANSLAQIGMARRKLEVGDRQSASDYFYRASQSKNLYALAWLVGNVEVQSQKLYYAQEIGRSGQLPTILPFMVRSGFLPSAGGDSLTVRSLNPPRVYTECLKGIPYCRVALGEDPDLGHVLLGQALEQQGNLPEAEYEYRQSKAPYALWRLSQLATDSKLSDFEKLTQKKQYEAAFRQSPNWLALLPFVQ
ncbi:MAG: hypothetical protein ORO03_00375 [Alphaproteobacteria bacterium]|nr:hypothetical protein [Alphaproteobacteria bacterium]